MKRDEVLSTLRAQGDRLRREHGVKSLRLFGSVARGEASPNSDVELLVEFDRPTGYFGLVQLQLQLEELLDRVPFGKTCTTPLVLTARSHRTEEDSLDGPIPIGSSWTLPSCRFASTPVSQGMDSGNDNQDRCDPHTNHQQWTFPIAGR